MLPPVLDTRNDQGCRCFVWQIEIDDGRHPVDIDAAGGNVGGDKYAGLAVAKTSERSFALRLGLVAVNAGRLDAGAGQVTHDAVGAMLGSGKDEHACEDRIAQHRRQQISLPMAVSVRPPPS